MFNSRKIISYCLTTSIFIGVGFFGFLPGVVKGEATSQHYRITNDSLDLGTFTASTGTEAVADKPLFSTTSNTASVNLSETTGLAFLAAVFLAFLASAALTILLIRKKISSRK